MQKHRILRYRLHEGSGAMKGTWWARWILTNHLPTSRYLSDLPFLHAPSYSESPRPTSLSWLPTSQVLRTEAGEAQSSPGPMKKTPKPCPKPGSPQTSETHETELRRPKHAEPTRTHECHQSTSARLQTKDKASARWTSTTLHIIA